MNRCCPRFVPAPKRGLVLLLLLSGLAFAQNFNADRYYQQCLRFEVGGDYETARESCLNALQVRPEFTEASLALARVEMQLGELASARVRLLQLNNRSDSAETSVLLAELAMASDELEEAELRLAEARNRLASTFNSDLAGRLEFLTGRLAEHSGHYSEALSSYREAILIDGLDLGYRLADAQLRFSLGDPEGGIDQLLSYQALSGDDRNPELRSLLGRLFWSLGDLEEASAQLELALQLRNARDTDAQARDLRALTVIYYAQGDLQSGGLALREATRRGNLVSLLLRNVLFWLLLLFIMVAVHLVGESRIANSTTLEVVEGPQIWSVGQLYAILFSSLALASLAALGYSVAMFDNPLAILTPLQDTEVRGVFMITFSLLLLVFTIQRVRRNGWDAFERLMGNNNQALVGAGVGILLLAATVAYLYYMPRDTLLGGFYLDLSRLTPILIAAVVLLPLTELFFRAFAFPALEKRYDRTIALIVSGSLSALILVSPVLLLVAFGLALAELFRRNRSGLVPFIAQTVFHVGLVIAVAFVPWVRTLFFL